MARNVTVTAFGQTIFVELFRIVLMVTAERFFFVSLFFVYVFSSVFAVQNVLLIFSVSHLKNHFRKSFFFLFFKHKRTIRYNVNLSERIFFLKAQFRMSCFMRSKMLNGAFDMQTILTDEYYRSNLLPFEWKSNRLCFNFIAFKYSSKIYKSVTFITSFLQLL